MKIRNIVIALIFPLFCFGACRNDDLQKQILIIYNNSNESIVPAFSYTPMDSINICIKPTDKFERVALEDATITANSSKKHENVVSMLTNNIQDTLYIYIYNRIDIDSLSCEDFNKRRPIQKSWVLTKTDAEALNWKLIYP